MHELSIAQNIVSLVDEAAKGRRIRRVNIEIGTLSGVMSDAVAFSFDIVAEGTAADGATLNIQEVAALARCDECGREFPISTLLTPCVCGSHRQTLLRGDELNILNIELEPETP
jgi:hydrogenase nickel incorporation protein HypA/HybF